MAETVTDNDAQTTTSNTTGTKATITDTSGFTPGAEPAIAGDPEPADRTFSQADLDRIVQDRLARQKAQFAGYDELKAKADKLDEIEAQSKSELEKANERAAKLEKDLADADAARKDAALRAAVVAEAAKKNVVDPDAAVQLISGIEFDDTGNPTNIAQAMDSLLEQRPYLVAPAGGARGNADIGARGGGSVDQLTQEQLKNMTPAEIVAADKEGRLNALKGIA